MCLVCSHKPSSCSEQSVHDNVSYSFQMNTGKVSLTKILLQVTQGGLLESLSPRSDCSSGTGLRSRTAWPFPEAKPVTAPKKTSRKTLARCKRLRAARTDLVAGG